MGTPTPRDLRLRRLYNVTEAEWQQVLEAQGQGCGICGKPGVSRSLATDHDHATGLFRGILCSRHNVMLREGTTAAILRAAADYLDHPPAIAVLGERFGVVGRISSRRRRRKR